MRSEELIERAREKSREREGERVNNGHSGHSAAPAEGYAGADGSVSDGRKEK